MDKIKIALPSKGRLRRDMETLFEAKQISFSNLSNDRDYIGSIEGKDNILIYFLSAKEITNRLEEGSIHLGLTGDDLVQEKVENFENKVSKLIKLDFGKANLVVAVPNFWIDVYSMADLEEICNLHRLKTTRRLRVATKYTNLTNNFFSKCGVLDYRTVMSHGSTESAPFNGFSEIITDITSSGETLKANNLRVLDDGIILRSSANIFKSNIAEWNSSSEKLCNEFIDILT